MSDLTEANRKHFDKVASNHQTDFGELIDAVIAELKSRREWICPKLADNDPNPESSTEVRLLDYACGAGTVSKALTIYTTQTIGLDLSTNMVAEYNKAAREAGCAPDRMQGYQFDLLNESTSSSTDESQTQLPSGTLAPFDVIAIGMALHHVVDPGRLLRRFSELLKPGGVCVVVDMVPGSTVQGDGENGQGHGEGSDLEKGFEPRQREVFGTIGKHGFTGEEMRDLYEGAGMGKRFEYVIFEERFRFKLFGRSFRSRGFIARGEKI